ncbi:MAG: hypothetical protein ACRDE9_02275 [Candidatus Limnocylindria bacterium]
MPKRISIALAATLLVALATADPVSAERERWTRGDAEAMLHTYPLTGEKIYERLDFAIGLDIRPFPEFYAATPYCVEDWHLLALALFDWAFVVVGGPFDGFEYTREEVQAFLSDLRWQFFLDGTIIETTAPPIRPLVPAAATRAEVEASLEEDFGGDVILGQGFGVQRGRIMAPGELAVGDHTLQVIVTYRPGTPDELLVSDGHTPFSVYAADSHACAGG